MQNNKLILLIAVVIITIACKKEMKEPVIIAELIQNENLIYVIHIENPSDKKIEIDQFVWSNATLILEIKKGEDRVAIPSPPPTPPLNKEVIHINPQGEINIELRGLEILKDLEQQESVQIRGNGTYFIDGHEKKLITNWITIN